MGGQHVVLGDFFVRCWYCFSIRFDSGGAGGAGGGMLFFAIETGGGSTHVVEREECLLYPRNRWDISLW